MTAAFGAAAGAEGVSWLDVAASGTGINESLKGIGTEAAKGFADSFNSQIQRVHLGIPGSGVVSDMATLGLQAASTFTGQFSRVLAGGLPDPKAFFNVFEQGVNTFVDNSVGKIPLVGTAFKAMWSSVEPLANDFVDVGLQMTEALERIGAQYMETSRLIAGQTLGTEHLNEYLTIVRDIAGSGELVHFQDVARAVGELGQRLSGLGDGAGLSHAQLQELTTTLALAQELLGGTRIDVDNLTAAFNDFNIAPEATSAELTTLTNLARETGTDFNRLITDVDRVAPSFQALGYNLEETAAFMATLNQEVGGPAMARIAYGLGAVEDKLKGRGVQDVAAGWHDVVSVVQQYLAAGDHAAAVDFLKDFVGSARTAETLVDAIGKNTAGIATGMGAALAQTKDLHQPLDEAVDKTRTLQDAWTQVGNMLGSVFAPMGVGLEQALVAMTDRIRDWISDNKTNLITWAGDIGHVVLTGIGDIAGVVSSTIMALEPLFNAIFKMSTSVFGGMLLALHGVLQAATHLPFIGGDFVDAANATGDLGGKLKDLSELDIAGNSERWAGLLSDLANNTLPGLDRQWRDNVESYKRYQEVTDAVAQNFKAAGQDAAKMQPVFDPNTTDGLKLLAGSDWGKVVAELGKLGIHLDIDQATGQVKSFTTDTQAEADTLQAYLKDHLGEKTWDELSPKLSVTVFPAPPMSNDDARAKAGLPPQIQVPVEVTPGSTLPGILGIPGQPVPPGSVPAPGGTPPPIELAPGVPLPVHPSGYVQIPGQVTILPAGNLTPGDVMDRAGVPAKLQGDVQGASPGVLLPTGLGVTDAPTPKTVGEVMDAVGIPYVNQTDDGVLLNVSFTMPPGGGGGGPGNAQYAGDGSLWNQFQQQFGGQFPDMPGLTSPENTNPGLTNPGGTRSVDWDGIAQHESGGDWTITHGEGPDVTGGLQIATATWLSHGGGAYAPKAFMASKAEQIAVAERILADPAQGPTAWPTTYRDHPELFGGQPLLSAQTGGTVPGPFTGRDSVPMALPSGTFVVNRAMSEAHGSLLDQLMSRGMVPTLAEAGERLIPPGIAGRNAALLEALNKGMLPLQGGGWAEAEAWAQYISGQPYNADSYLDCSGYTSSVWGVATGKGPGRHWDTTADFAALGFLPGTVEGDFNIAVNPKPGMSGHMIAQLPNGVVIESSDRIKYGSTTSMNSPQFSAHWHYPVGHNQNPALGVSGAGFSLADYTSGGGGGGGTPGFPTTSAPTAPGTSYGDVAPPAAYPPVPAGTPGAIKTPYGAFQYTFDMPAEQQALLTPEQRQKFDQWLNRYDNAASQAAADQDAITKATDRQREALDKKTAADNEYATQQARILPSMTQAQRDLITASTEYTAAQNKAQSADTEYAAATDALNNAKTRQQKNVTQQNIADEAAPPWISTRQRQQITPDQNAQQLGAGLVKGVLQELGFPDVFGKAFTNWGAWKLGMGGLGYGMGLLDAMANPQSGGGGGGGQQTSPLLGLLSGVFPSLKDQLQGQPPGTTGPGPAPTIALGGPRGPLPGPVPGTENRVAENPTQLVDPSGKPLALIPKGTPLPGGKFTLPGGQVVDVPAPAAHTGAPAPGGPGTPTVHTAAAHQPDAQPAANWIPGGLNPGLHMASPAAMIQGSGFETFAAGFLGGIPSAASVVGALTATQPPREEQPPPANGGGPNLSINYDQRGSWQPTPQMRDDVRDIAYTTSAPQTAGGAGLPV